MMVTIMIAGIIVMLIVIVSVEIMMFFTGKVFLFFQMLFYDFLWVSMVLHCVCLAFVLFSLVFF